MRTFLLWGYYAIAAAAIYLKEDPAFIVGALIMAQLIWDREHLDNQLEKR